MMRESSRDLHNLAAVSVGVYDNERVEVKPLRVMATSVTD